MPGLTDARRRRLLTGILVAVAVVLLGGGALASIPDASGVIHGCYLTSGNPNVRGALRLIDTQAGETCTSGEASISWRSGGLSGREVVRASYTATFVPPTFADVFRVDCPVGKVAMGGGGQAPTDPRGLVMFRSQPDDDPAGQRTWFVGFKDVTATESYSVSVYVFAVCASAG